MGNYQQRRILRRLRESNHYNVAILGSGLAALVAHRLIPGSIIITKKHLPLFLNNVFFHDRVETRLLLNGMGFSNFTSRVVPFYYMNGHSGSLENEVTDEQRIQIITEKMGDLGINTGDISLSTKIEVNEEFRMLEFDENEFVLQMTEQSTILQLDFKQIQETANGVDIILDDGSRITFDRLVNTIPQNAFANYVNRHMGYDNYKAMPVTFVNCKNPLLSVRDKSYMVYTFNGMRWKRILCKNNIAAIEYNTDNIDDAMIQKDFPGLIDYKIQTIPYGRIMSQKVYDSKRIIHLGRFAEWNHRISTEHVINKICTLNF
jgi:hypothetical protein